MIFNVPNWDSSRANFLSMAGQNSNIYKRFILKAGHDSNLQTGNCTTLQEHTHTSTLVLHCFDESQFHEKSKILEVISPSKQIYKKNEKNTEEPSILARGKYWVKPFQ